MSRNSTRKPSIFYVYAHYLEDSDIPFYIGKGTGKRAYSKSGHSARWRATIKNKKYRVVILKERLTEESALNIERKLIRKYGRLDQGRGPLINMDNGGRK